MLIRLAWKNIWRNKSRSLVITIAVVLGLWGGIFSDAFMQGMTEQQVHASIYNETGHIQLNAPDFLVNHDMQRFIPRADSVDQALREMPMVKAVAPRIQVTAMVSTASASAGIMINGIDPAALRQVSDLPKHIAEGNYFSNDQSNEALIGHELANTLHCKLHSRLVLTLQSMEGEITYASFRVAGIFKTQNSEFDKQMMFVRKSDLSRIIQFPDSAASLITVLLNRDSDTDPALDQIRSAYPRWQVQSWLELSPMLRVISGTMKQTTLIFVGIILIALAFGIVNTMLMAVMDRTREIGMLLSVGMRPGKVFWLIILETLFLSLTGAAIGVLLSIATISWFGSRGINLSGLAEGINAWGYSSIIYPKLGAGFYAELALMVIVIAVIAGLFPARRAIRLKPAEAIRGE